MDFWTILGTLNYALIDLFIAELLGYMIIKFSHFKKSEYFVFGTIFFGIIIFYLSNELQDLTVGYIKLFKGWLFPLFLGAISLDIFLLSKFILKRRWDFRLVKISFMFLSITIVILAYLISVKVYG